MFTNETTINFVIIAGTAVSLLVAITWAARSLIIHEINRRHLMFQQQLQADVNQTLEQFRKSLADEKMIFGAMQDARAEPLVQLYGMMIELAKNCRGLSKPGLSNLPLAVATARQFMESVQHFFDLYEKNGIYFSDDFCKVMNASLAESERTTAAMVATLGRMAATPEEEQQMIAMLQAAWGEFEMTIPRLITEMKTEFHRVVGGQGRWF
jgi:hypothetical protein